MPAYDVEPLSGCLADPVEEDVRIPPHLPFSSRRTCTPPEGPVAVGALLGTPPIGGGKETNRTPNLKPADGPGRHVPHGQVERPWRKSWTGNK
jgi:hypothetical protein